MADSIPPMISKLVSGGQTGADRAALDAAMARGLPYGGWCPKGRRAEDGVIPAQYVLVETPSANYLQRTEWNVRDSDGTVVFTLAGEASGGSKKTIQFARRLKKPCLHLGKEAEGDAVVLLCEFIARHGIDANSANFYRDDSSPDDFLNDGYALTGSTTHYFDTNYLSDVGAC